MFDPQQEQEDFLQQRRTATKIMKQLTIKKTKSIRKSIIQRELSQGTRDATVINPNDLGIDDVFEQAEELKQDSDEIFDDILDDLKVDKNVIQMFTQLDQTARAEKWLELVGNRIKIDLTLYHKQLATVKNFEQHMVNYPLTIIEDDQVPADPNGEPHEKFKALRNTISEDLEHTHAAQNFFKEGDKWHENVRTVLLCYFYYKPVLGYSHGMNLLASTIYLVVQDDLKCFTMMSNMISKPGNLILRDFLLGKNERVDFHCQILNKILAKKIPGVLTRKQSKGVLTNCDAFLKDWFVTLFSGLFSIQCTLKLWDEILTHGDFFIVKIALSIFDCVNNQSKDVEDYENFNKRFYQIDQYVTEDQLFQSMNSLKFGEKEFMKVKLEVK